LDQNIRHCLRANFESDDSYQQMHCLAEKHMAFQTSQFPFTASLPLSERATFGRSSEISLSPFNDWDPRGHFRVTLPHWHIGIFVGTAKVFCHNVINGWSGIFKERIVSVAKRSAQRSSMIAVLRLYFDLVSTSQPFWKYDYLLASCFLGLHQPLAEA